MSVLKHSLQFSGRSGRAEFWYFLAVTVVIGIGLQAFDFMIGIPIFGIMFMLAAFLPSVAVSIRRLHDSDRTGWWLLVGLIPVLGAFAVLALMVIPGSESENRFGKKPLPPAIPLPFGTRIA